MRCKVGVLVRVGACPRVILDGTIGMHRENGETSRRVDYTEPVDPCASFSGD